MGSTKERGFENVYDDVVKAGRRAERSQISPQMRTMLRNLYDALVAQPISAQQAHTAVVDILFFLTTEEGRTDANCWAVDVFLDEVWGSTEAELPDDLSDILADMAGALHDTIAHPEIAINFDSTPEQLLQRAMSICIGDRF